MPRVEPLSRAELTEFEPFFTMLEEAGGFVPNSMLTLGRSPELLRAFSTLSAAVLGGGGKIPRELKQLVAFVASQAAGCRYCQAHTANHGHALGVAVEKLAAAFEFETSDLFDDRERAALRIARDAAVVPNATTDEQFEELRDRRCDLDVRLAESLERHDGHRAREQPPGFREARALGKGLGGRPSLALASGKGASRPTTPRVGISRASGSPCNPPGRACTSSLGRTG
jgi:AhpD family alkylhydroperoxidase